MDWDWVALAFLCGVCFSADAVQPPGKGTPLAGWPGVFPELPGYQRTFTDPVVDSGKKAYRQTVKYEWTGGAIKLLEVTLARDPAFEQRHTEDVLARDPQKPERVTVSKVTGWLWRLAKEGDKGPWPLQARLLLPLGKDRALILDAKGQGPWQGLTEVARKFDLKKIEKALETPPRTDARRTLDAFRQLTRGMSYADAAAWVGPADEDIGSGIHVMAYRLEDGSRVLLGFPDFNRLIYVRHQPKCGEARDLVK
jgi:hypothetical protein